MTDTDTTADPQAPPRLTRDPEGGHWLGVAAGLARYFRLDPVLPRIAFIVLTFVGGLGLLLYLALWLVMSEAHETTTPGEMAAQRLRDAPTWLSVTVIVLGVLWLGGITGFSGPGLVWGLALIGLGVLLFQQDSARQTAARTASVPPPPPPPGTAAAEQPTAAGPGHPPGSAAGPRPTPASPPEPPRSPSVLGRLTVGLALLVVGGAALLATATGATFGARTYLALGLVVIGAGLLVGAWWGRARWLVVVGLLLVPLALASGLRGLPAVSTIEVGQRQWEPQTVAEIAADYSLFAGEGALDLTGVDFPRGRTTTVTGSVALGQFTVIVPADVQVAVQGSVVAGEIMVFGTTDNGMFVDVGRGAATADADLVVDLSGGFGQLMVERATTADGAGPSSDQTPTDRSAADQNRLR